MAATSSSSSSSLCDEQDEREQRERERVLLCGEADLLRLRESGERDALLRLVGTGDGDRDRERESLRSGETWREVTRLVCCGEDIRFLLSVRARFFLLRNVILKKKRGEANRHKEEACAIIMDERSKMTK